MSKLPAPAEEAPSAPVIMAPLPVALPGAAEGRPAATTADLKGAREKRRVEPPASHLGKGRDDEAKDNDGGDVASELPPAGDDASPDDTPSKADGVAGKSVATPRSAPLAGKTEGAELLASQFALEKKGELLVNGLSDDDVAAARARGLIVSEPTELKGAGTKTFRLSAPGLTAQEVERDLHRTLALHDVQQNFAYNIFMGNVGLTDQLVDRSASVAANEPCPDKTCFGGTLIKWTPVLNACTKGVRVGIVDTSFDTRHPAFKGRSFISREFLNGEGASPFDWHGTAILSLLAGDSASGTPGLITDATFLLAAAFRSDVNGNASTDTLRLLAALDWLDSENVDIVNMSFSGPQDPALAKAIERMSSKGVVFVAAAGNMGPTAGPSYPAAYPHVIAVTAVNRDAQNYGQANRGAYIDVSAPGVDILTALPNARQGYRTGTSFAVPFITAIAATNVNGQDAVATDDLVRRITTRDLGPPGQDEIYGAGLALAPATCKGGGDSVAESGSGFGSWATTTTFVKANTGFGP
ncbi:MAG: S8 family serine peptidase [Hyphomicrobium sp.]|uniref:S8 family serine peptidase n=1 Tax=Hyphomicrobium sp. TaxID=82 RepID=UPI003D0E6D97